MHPIGTQIEPKDSTIDIGAQKQALASALCTKAGAESEVYRSEKNIPRKIQRILKGVRPLEGTFGTFPAREKYTPPQLG